MSGGRSPYHQSVHDPLAPNLLARLPSPPSKVALLKASRIGDFICAGPAFGALRKALRSGPQPAEITLITLPMLVELARRMPYFDRVVAFPGFPGIAEQFFEPHKAVTFLAEMQAERFDLAVQFQGSGVFSNPFILLLGAKAAAGFIRPGDPPGLLEAALPWPDEGHEIARMLALAEFLGASCVAGEKSELCLRAEDFTAAEALLAGLPHPLIGLHPAARDRTRCWPLERFAAAGKAMRQARGGSFVLLGEEAGRGELETLGASLGAPVVNLAGRTSLPVLGAVLSRLDVLVTNDSGPAHLAYALDVPTVTIFGSYTPERYGAHHPGPFRMLAHPIPCRPCGLSECPIGLPCLLEISVEEVVQAGIEVMDYK